jgi:hypothetical protein
MTPKQFLKPNWRKIVVFIIIITIGFLIPLIPAYCDVSPFAGICAPEMTCNYNWFQLIRFSDLFESYGARQPCGIVNYDSNISYLSFSIIVVDIIFWYIMSCFIVCIYDKVKKKK